MILLAAQAVIKDKHTIVRSINGNMHFMEDRWITSNDKFLFHVEGKEILEIDFHVDTTSGSVLSFKNKCKLEKKDRVVILDKHVLNIKYNFMFHNEGNTENAQSFFYENSYDFSTHELENIVETAMYVDSRVKAKACLNYMLKEYKKANPGLTDEEMLKSIKSKLGYYASYYGLDVRHRVEKIYDTEHPVFGKITEMGEPSSEEALQCGMYGLTLKELRNLTTEELEDIKNKNMQRWNTSNHQTLRQSHI